MFYHLESGIVKVHSCIRNRLGSLGYVLSDPCARHPIGIRHSGGGCRLELLYQDQGSSTSGWLLKCSPPAVSFEIQFATCCR